MSEVESVLSAEQRARGQALIIARDVLKATSFVSSSAVAAADLITVAEYVLRGLALESGGDVSEGAGELLADPEGGKPVLIVQLEEIRDKVRLVRDKLIEGVEGLGEHGDERLNDGHDVSSRVDGQAVESPDPVVQILEDAADTNPSRGVGGGAAGPEPVAPNSVDGATAS